MEKTDDTKKADDIEKLEVSSKVKAMDETQCKALKQRIKELAHNNCCITGLSDNVTYSELKDPIKSAIIKSVYQINDADIAYIMKNG